MRITGGEIAIRHREARILLDREHEFRHCFIEPPSQEMRLAYYSERRADPSARAEPQRGLAILDRKVGLAREKPENGADVPTACKIRVECEGTIDQRDHGADILAEIASGEGDIDNGVRIVAGHLQ